jgi:hypothetical protein
MKLWNKVSVQTKINRNLENEKEEQMKINLQNCMHIKKFGNYMEDYLCVGDFIMSMIIQKLILRIYKSCVVSFVIKNL